MTHDPALVEAVARGLCNRRKPKPSDPAMDAWGLLTDWATTSCSALMERNDFLSDATAALDAIEAQGWVVLPVELPLADCETLGRQMLANTSGHVGWRTVLIEFRKFARQHMAARAGASE